MSGSQKDKHRLTVIKEPLPGTRATLTSNSGGPIFFTGSEEVPDLVCGKCERILVSGRRTERMGDWVLKCQYCGAFNDTSLPVNRPAKRPMKASSIKPA
jgi:hypothetical protein